MYLSRQFTNEILECVFSVIVNSIPSWLHGNCLMLVNIRDVIAAKSERSVPNEPTIYRLSELRPLCPFSGMNGNAGAFVKRDLMNGVEEEQEEVGELF
ncbi:hypothetical protein PHET_00402 [Paragonimus heterotremus]|uniref:Uncharacterized protein n=1 Tax=Paragonimus heterotremus TaxID=100268 RepID=A0A8J4TPV7_9TREM|nr:hypothetical protein PHET_00402 [Paragonimus heterotremus]